jgi:glycosyltransferase involved in cell wall biosynthesis
VTEMEKNHPLKIMLVADGRSPTARSWIAMLEPLGFHITLVSSYLCEPVKGVRELYILPLAFAQFAGSQVSGGTTSVKKGLVNRFRPFVHTVRHWLGPWTIAGKAREYRRILAEVQPDLVHALRIPFEGMLASYTPLSIPLVVSTWGNDLTLHAPSTPKMSSLTRQTLRRADAFISDAPRDARLAREWGYDSSKPAMIAPGNGGLDLEKLVTATHGVEKADPPQVLNPRGIRSQSVRVDTFFKSIPLVLGEYPQVHFVCASMAGQKEAEDWVRKLDIEKNVTLLPFLPQPELWQEFARSQISLSISEHDGTPNSLLEAMALGCLPICGDIESIRDWITSGENGLLVDPADPVALAKAMLAGLSSTELRSKAARLNLQIIEQKATVEKVRVLVKEFLGATLVRKGMLK